MYSQIDTKQYWTIDTKKVINYKDKPVIINKKDINSRK